MAISTVSRDIHGERYSMKLSASAMVRITRMSAEWNDGKRMGIGAAINSIFIEGDPDVERLFSIAAEMLNDGKGATLDEALDLFDAMDLQDVFEWFNEACEAGQPSDGEGASGQSAEKSKAAKPKRATTSTA